MKHGAPGSFGAQLKALRETAGFTQEELATIAGLSVHAVSALERGERRRPHVETVRALSAALDLTSAKRDALLGSARGAAHNAAVDELSDVSLPSALTALLGRDADVQTLRRWLADPTARLITLTGPGGAGKTRLALELARAIAAEGGTRVVFVPLAAIRSAEFVAPAIAEAFGLSDVTALDLPKRARVACGDQSHLAAARQFRADPGRGPAGRGSPDIGRAAPSAGHQPGSASRARRAGVRRGAARVGCRTSTPRPPPILRALQRCGCLWNGFGMCSLTFASRLRTAPRDGDLSAARCTAACARARGPVDQSADRRGSAPATDARRPAPDRRPARSARTPADDECDGRLELSTAGARMNSACSAGSARCRVVFRSRPRRRSWPVETRPLTAAMKRLARWPA